MVESAKPIFGEVPVIKWFGGDDLQKIMNKYYFYCPNCKLEGEVDELSLGTMANTRGGYGTPIYHFECLQCHNLDAGFMRYGVGKMSEIGMEEQKQYFRSVISQYQNIRGIKR